MYNRRNILTRIIEIQNITLENTQRGVSQKHVYDMIVYPHYFISYSCYNKYLACNARRELKELEEATARQLRFDFKPTKQ